MEKLLKDPAVMEQCAKILSNPSIMKQMGDLLNNPDKVASLTNTLLNEQGDASTDRASGKHRVGTKVRISGLSKSELNGRTGVVQSYDASTARYVVQLDEPASKQIAIKQANCTQIDSSDIAEQ